MLIGTAIACLALAVLIWLAFSQQSSSALTSSADSLKSEVSLKRVESQNGFARQNTMNLSPSEKERLSKQQIFLMR